MEIIIEPTILGCLRVKWMNISNRKLLCLYKVSTKGVLAVFLIVSIRGTGSICLLPKLPSLLHAWCFTVYKALSQVSADLVQQLCAVGKVILSPGERWDNRIRVTRDLASEEGESSVLSSNILSKSSSHSPVPNCLLPSSNLAIQLE